MKSPISRFRFIDEEFKKPPVFAAELGELIELVEDSLIFNINYRKY